jgi:serine protease AprX
VGEKVIAEAVVRAADGSSILDAPDPVTEATIGRYRASEANLAEAAARLEALGIDVVARGPTGLTLSANTELFERTFGTAIDGPAVPEDLADVIAAIVLPERPELFP